MANQFAAQIVIVVVGPMALERIGWKFFLVLLCPTAGYVGVIYIFSFQVSLSFCLVVSHSHHCLLLVCSWRCSRKKWSIADFCHLIETKNRSREDINAEFGDRVAVHYFGATEEGQLEYAKAIDGGEGTLANVTRGGEKDDEVQQIDIVKKG